MMGRLNKSRIWQQNPCEEKEIRWDLAAGKLGATKLVVVRDERLNRFRVWGERMNFWAKSSFIQW